MSIKDQLLRSVTQLETDSGLVHNWAHGDANTQVQTERGVVRSNTSPLPTATAGGSSPSAPRWKD